LQQIPARPADAHRVATSRSRLVLDVSHASIKFDAANFSAGSFFAPAVNKCRLETKVEGGPKIRVYIWEANAGWIVWSDDAVDALMKASANR